MGIATGRKALITGGASGFGREIASRLHAAGAQVAILDVHAERARETAAALDERSGVAAAGVGAGALGLGADVRSPEAVQAAVGEAIDAFGGLDTVVISAGVFHMGPLREIAESDWDRVLDVNLKGAFTTAQATMPALSASGRGRLVLIGSDASKRGFPLQLAYTASKFGLVGLTESLAGEFAADAVTVNCVCPVGCPTTGMGQEVLGHKIADGSRTAEQVMSAAARTNPLGRNATEVDVADAALFFVSDEASFLTGVALDVDGGAHVGAVPGI